MTSANLLSRMMLLPRGLINQVLIQSSSTKLHHFHRSLSNNFSLITKIHRESYLKMYPVLVVQADGSTFYTRYHEPRSIIQLPLDITTLSPEELKVRLERRNPKKKVVYAKEEKDNYQASKYIKLIKKKK
ncbi:39S ribosomal protein L55, mitochondrial [Frankliniella fusca]|uniref:39S ribosomal protein L55, mitochondrial n=1 Tax=Frankliniella fusca TaxID=407009 RepID=A0AAE1L7R8_9NEOP|nr:39S ribosomal protein L55, mitochondrial [Frankliniella fusca]